MPDQNQSGGADVESGGDTTIGGDVVGRDKITTTHTTHVGADSVARDKITTTTVHEGGPTARYAVIGLAVVAALAIVVMGLIVFGGNPPPTPSPTAGVTATFPAVVVVPTSTPTVEPSRTPEPTLPPSPTATGPPLTATPTPSPLPPTATDTPNPLEIPTPTSALPVYDGFDDRCLDAERWDLKVEPVGPETPAPTAIPSQGNCLQAQRQFFTEGANRRLSVFVSLEGDVTHSLAQKSNACYDEVEVVTALNEVQNFDEPRVHSSYLSLGLALTRQSGMDGFLEVRLEGSNASGRLSAQITSRWTIATGYINLGTMPYTFRQPVTVAFRVADVGRDGGEAGAAAENKRLTVYVDDKQIGPSFSMISACGLTIGYHADAPTLLDGYFDEVRLLPLPANQ